ncbi:hypothetical protein [Sphingosinicella soli]|uniref:PilZ domain-containing protein n=1 Tax=Sphingosinicella soli TaxID=333708 RepID=A0A7W7B4P4_9SPHN|nr:hypothetical protein [Sphingosinicella soli]MBB4633941.1 hypothetical protein [Sphingosinicella soli]
MRIINSVQAPVPNTINISQDPRRGADPSVQTMLSVGHATLNTDHGLIPAKNISDKGASPWPDTPLTLDDALTLELPDGGILVGRVVWTAGEDCGLTFDQSINCTALLTNPAAGSQQHAACTVRLPMATSAVTRGANGTRFAMAPDVSLRNMKTGRDGSFIEGLYVKITLPFGLKRRGVVRWAKDNFAEVKIIAPLSAEKFGFGRASEHSVQPASGTS